MAALPAASALRASLHHDDNALRAPRWETLPSCSNTANALSFDAHGRFLAVGTTGGEVSRGGGGRARVRVAPRG